jgi:hypothetical protein
MVISVHFCYFWLPLYTFNMILTYFNENSKDSCVQYLQDPASSTFNVILTYGRLSWPYTNERLPEDEDLLVETYVGACISFSVNFPIVH